MLQNAFKQEFAYGKMEYPVTISCYFLQPSALLAYVCFHALKLPNFQPIIFVCYMDQTIWAYHVRLRLGFVLISQLLFSTGPQISSGGSF